MTENLIEQLDHIFKPKSVAVIGASKDRAKWGGRMISQALNSQFRGRVYPVNPNGRRILGVKTYPDVMDVPDDVDMAVFTVPAKAMPTVMKSCVKKGVKGGVMISADFAETGDMGRSLQEETVKIAREGGLRFVGPNGNGMWTSAVRLNVSPFENPLPGPVAFISQSGSFGGVAARAVEAKGFGLSKFISIGNQADLTATDYLEYLAQDDDTKVITMYMEGFKDGRRFFDTARQVSRIKPVLIFKGGSSNFGARATLSHTASIAGADEIFDAMCRQAGIIRVAEIDHLFIMAEALFSQPLPPGKRIAVIGNGGQGVTTVDMLAAANVDVPEFKEEDKRRLKEVMPPHAPVPRNPVDYAAGMMEGMAEVQVLEMLASMDYIDGIITTLPGGLSFNATTLVEYKKAALDITDAFCQIPKKFGKPIIVQKWFVPGDTFDVLKNAQIPMYDKPADCARAMTALVKYAQIKKGPAE